MFTTTPEEYGSLYKNQNFEFTGTYIEDHTYVIKEVTSDKIIGVKKFYQTNTASLNISPIARPFAIPAIEHYPMGFVEQERFGSVKISLTKTGTVESDEVESSECVLSLSKQKEETIGFVSSLSKSRAISLGERELLLIRCDPTAKFAVRVEQYSYEADANGEEVATASMEYSLSSCETGFTTFSLTSTGVGTLADAPETIARMTVTLYKLTLINPGFPMPIYSYEAIDAVNYTMIDEPRSPVRVAWISERGSVEHYTMPYTLSEMLQAGDVRVLTLRSALEDYPTRRILAQILNSEVIWIADTEEYRVVELVDTQIELSPDKDLASMLITIRDRG